MEHYYVVCGNEFGVDITTKKNFTKLEDATEYFEEVKYDDFGCKIMFVDSNGIEKQIKSFVNE